MMLLEGQDTEKNGIMSTLCPLVVIRPDMMLAIISKKIICGLLNVKSVKTKRGRSNESLVQQPN